MKTGLNDSALKRSAGDGLTQAERSAETRARAIGAAVSVINEVGYSGATVAAIAEAAGLSPGALRHQFPSQAKLMTEVVRQASEGHLVRYKAAVDQVMAPIDRASAIIDVSWEMAKEDEFAAMMEIQLARRRDRELDAEAGPVFSEIEQKLERWFLDVGIGHFDEERFRLARLCNNIVLAGAAFHRVANIHEGRIDGTFGTWRSFILELLLK